MTKGDLIVACIKIMYDNNDDDINQRVDEISISNNEEYKSKTINIIESINRALDEIAKASKLPILTKEIDAFYFNNSYEVINSNNIPLEKYNDSDYVKVVNTLYKWSESENKYIKQELPLYFAYPLDNKIMQVLDVKYELNTEYLYQSLDTPLSYKGNNLMLLRHNNGNYVITFVPTFKRLKYSDDDTTEIVLSDDTPIPDYILDIIPYFVKGDMYEEDNPQMAVFARNLFITYLSEIVSPYDRQQQTKVESSYTMW